jgi:four helix bundle protein
MFVFEKEVMCGNAVLEKSFKFSIRIVKLYEYLINKNRNVEPLLMQLLRSGTSIGANITEAQSAYT